MEELITAFRPITLEEMSGVKLMNRIDTKFITTRPILQRLLTMAQADYMLQEIDGERNLEIKRKNNHGRTKKKRIAVTDMDLSDAAKCQFVGKHLRYDIGTLSPALTNSFRRLTLVNTARTERVTIDTELSFHNERSQADRQMGALVVIEVKRDGLCPSPMLGILHQLRIQPHGFSKYCMGSALTNPGLRINRFKPKLHDVERLLGGIRG